MHNSEILFSFLAVSQNLNNDLWSKLQGYPANKVVRVMFKGLFLNGKKKKNQFPETDTSLWKMKLSTLKENRNGKWKVLSCIWLCDPMDCSPSGFSYPWNSSGKNTGVGSHSLLQGIFLMQGSNLGLPYCRQILYHLNHWEKPLEKENPILKGHLWYLWKQPPGPLHGLFLIPAPSVWGSSNPSMDRGTRHQGMKCWATVKS